MLALAAAVGPVGPVADAVVLQKRPAVRMAAMPLRIAPSEAKGKPRQARPGSSRVLARRRRPDLASPCGARRAHLSSSSTRTMGYLLIMWHPHEASAHVCAVEWKPSLPATVCRSAVLARRAFRPPRPPPDPPTSCSPTMSTLCSFSSWQTSRVFRLHSAVAHECTFKVPMRRRGRSCARSTPWRDAAPSIATGESGRAMAPLALHQVKRDGAVSPHNRLPAEVKAEECGRQLRIGCSVFTSILARSTHRPDVQSLRNHVRSCSIPTLVLQLAVQAVASA